jgi:hypothetical protein
VKFSAGLNLEAAFALLVGVRAESRVVQRCVFGLGWMKLKVLDPIVELVSVFVVDDLAWMKRSPQVQFHHSSVFKHLGLPNPNPTVASFNGSVFSEGATFTGKRCASTLKGAKPLPPSFARPPRRDILSTAVLAHLRFRHNQLYRGMALSHVSLGGAS